MKKLVTFLFMFLFCAVSKAQQDPQYTMYMFNMMSINPAYAGTKDHTDATLLGRKQWVNYNGAPQTLSFNIHTPVFYDKIGLGLSVINDKLGIMNHNIINFAFSYHAKFKKSLLSLGLQPSITQFSSNLSTLKIDAPGSPAIPDNAFQNLSETAFKAGGGLFWYNNNGYLGLSTPLLAKVRIGGTSSGGIITPYKSTPHLFIAGGYVFNVGSGKYKIKPSTLIKYTNGAPLEFDLNCNFYFNNVFGIGASWRSFDSMDAILEYTINKNLKIGYAYDYTLTNLRNYNSGSHEIIVNWQFGFKKGKILTPRYF
jgi:type IX secretion system PorP/SprF family membrane protein